MDTCFKKAWPIIITLDTQSYDVFYTLSEHNKKYRDYLTTGLVLPIFTAG